MKFIRKRPCFTSDFETNVDIAVRMKAKRYFLKEIRMEEDSFYILKGISRTSFQKYMSTLNICHLQVNNTGDASSFRKFGRITRCLQKINIDMQQLSSTKIIQRLIIPYLAKKIKSVNLSFYDENLSLEISAIYHALRRFRNIQALRYSFETPLEFYPNPSRLMRPRLLTNVKHFQNLVLSPLLIRSKAFGLKPEIVSKMENLKSLELMGSIWSEDVVDTISYIKRLGRLNLDSLKLSLFSGEDICRLISSLATFIALTPRLKTVSLNMDCVSSLYNELLAQSILALAHLEELNISIKKWDAGFMFGLIAENLKNMPQLKKLYLTIDGDFSDVEQKTWKVLGTSLKALKSLEDLRLTFLVTGETKFDVTFKEIDSLPRLKSLSLNIYLSKSNVNPTQLLFKKLGTFKGLEKLSINLNMNRDLEVHPKIFEGFLQLGKELRKLNSLEVSLGKMSVKTFVLPQLMSSFLQVETLKVFLDKPVNRSEWIDLLNVLSGNPSKIRCFCIDVLLDVSFQNSGITEGENLLRQIRELKNWERLELIGVNFPRKGEIFSMYYRNEGRLLKHKAVKISQ